MSIKAIRGTRDILPEDARLWQAIEKKAGRLCEVYGYQEIRTPILEEARLFMRSIGKSSDIVRKEMYSFLDRKKRMLCLRPEGTAGIVRAYLEHDLDKNSALAKFYYLGPMFRAERPQAGRLRQFHHIGVEAIGSSDPYLDAEVISLAFNLLREIGVNNSSLQLNSIGCRKDRQRYEVALREKVAGKLRFLCADCRSRHKVNILRIFDCKNEACKRLKTQLPSIVDFLCSQCAEHFLQVKQILDSLNIVYTCNPYLVRGLDYYTKTCFELIHPQLGAQDAVGAGGRYDNLVGDLGGAQNPAIGFALGLERVISALDTEIRSCAQSTPDLYIATLGEEAKKKACKILHALRTKGIRCETDYQQRSLKSQMRLADKLQFKYVAILGEEELKKEMLILRDMQNKSQKELKIDNLTEGLN